ncbi:inactive sodium-dependent neutral amino acid transporter B(0)AT3 [Triplophysa rosa]|uniref:inactive sodium-dependent neutral amino acid transporter B(0)AT3 n=1 Tax=Triplophysa rosa TaxID=992332 RepID=UPI002545CE80|nr:inactive sodium-dependent neutral amino acid transporter B(0)AT3 [Triplophysa rosa]
MDTSSTNSHHTQQRPKWDNKVQYLLTCIGFAVGLGNVWRFPYLCQIYGGGAFLIPYLIALVFEGLPLLYLELAIGQSLRMGSIGVWHSISPLLGGVGVASMIISFLVGLFYNTILAWVLWYFFHSFQEPLPWSQCPVNDNLTGYVQECVLSTPVNYFWYRKTLNITPDIEESGSLQWWLVVCLASAWSIVYICFIRGIETIGKAVYVTATFPYLVLTIFLIRALTLPGATDGLLYLFTPDRRRLYASSSPDSILALQATSNYNSVEHNNILDLTNAFHLGDQNITIENYDRWLRTLNASDPEKVSGLNLKLCVLKNFLDQSASGTGLAFLVFTEAVLEMPGSQVWAVLFFIMLFSLGLSSMFGNLEGVLTPLLDLHMIPKWIPKELFTGLMCVVCFLVALIFTLGSGNYWLEIFNSYVGSVPLLVIAFFELVGVVVFYGMDRFSDDIEMMTGRRPNLFWRVCWMGVSPLLLLVVLVAYIIIQVQKHPTYPTWNPAYVNFPEMEEKPYSPWVFAICVLLSSVPVISIPIVAAHRLMKRQTRPRNSETLPNPYHNPTFTPDPVLTDSIINTSAQTTV